MDREIQILYTQLTQENRDKVDTKIRELFVEQQEQFAAGSRSGPNTAQ